MVRVTPKIQAVATLVPSRFHLFQASLRCFLGGALFEGTDGERSRFLASLPSGTEVTEEEDSREGSEGRTRASAEGRTERMLLPLRTPLSTSSSLRTFSVRTTFLDKASFN